MRGSMILIVAMLSRPAEQVYARRPDTDRRAVIQAEDAWRKVRIDADTRFLERF